MAYSYPLNLAQFSDRLRVIGLTMRCPRPTSSSRTRGGEVMRAGMGAALWQGECTLGFEQLANTRGMRGLIDMLMDENASFIFSPVDYFGPASDRMGTALTGASVQLVSVASNNRDMTIEGLPAGFVVSFDDLLSFTYGAAPIRYGMHRVVTPSAVANAQGRATFEVWPRVRPGWQAGAAIQLKKPRFKAVMNESEGGAAAGLRLTGMSFTYVQQLG